MLSITADQFSGLTALVRRNALITIKAEATRHFPTFVNRYAPAAVDAIIDRAVVWGTEIGCRTRLEHVLWLALTMADGADPRGGSHAPVVNRILANLDAPIENRLRQLVGQLIGQAAEQPAGA